jgi:hypothetical protein
MKYRIRDILADLFGVACLFARWLYGLGLSVCFHGGLK